MARFTRWRRAPSRSAVLSAARVVVAEPRFTTHFVRDGRVSFLLHNPDFTSAARMAEAINIAFPTSEAIARDAATVDLILPADYANRDVAFLADVGAVEVVPDALARVVINERTGTIVATAPVSLSQVAISHGSLTITIASTLDVSQPEAFSRGGQTVVVPSTQTEVEESEGGFTVIDEAPSVERLAFALNALGVSTREMMAIFQSLKRAGSLQAELIIN